jgi:phenylalanyl-tRNA synthetase beta chain
MPPFTGGVDPPASEQVRISIDAPDLCSRYIGCVITGVSVRASPPWLQRRLRAAGVRPINNVVDVTNYVLLEYGQPLHAFDLDRIAGREIKVRLARAGEALRCLDGQVRDLSAEMLVIADSERPVALAGIIGGEETAVGEGTTRILLEAACFDGPAVRATSRRLALRTEASTRFEKQLSAELALAGARRAATLLSEVTGGQVHRDWPDVYPVPQQPVMVRLWPAQIDSVLGVHVPLEEAEAILRRLGFHIRVEEQGAWDVLPPVFRLDVAIPEDVVEEVGRIHGYDKIPATLPGSRHLTWQPAGPARPLDAIREVMVGAGFTETVTPALVPSRWMQRLGLDDRMLRIANPLSDDLDATRTSLLPSLLQVALLNRNRGRAAPALFEIGRAFLKRAEDPDGQPAEPLRMGAVAVVGAGSTEAVAAIQDLKSALERVAHELAAPAPRYGRAVRTIFHPGRCASVEVGQAALGWVGELHPAVLAAMGLGARAAALEIDLEGLLAGSGERRASPLPRYPPAERDLSLVVSEDVPAAALMETIRVTAADLLESIRAFDEYRGSQLPDGSKSVSFALTFRSPERTLTDSEVNPLMEAVLTRLRREHGAAVRA